MAKDFTNSLKTYYLNIESSHIDSLAQIRHWEHLKVAFHQEEIWITNFKPDEIEHALILSLPNKAIYYEKENLLFPIKSLLPEKEVPRGLLWTPIIRAIALEYPTLNRNYFGVNQHVNIKLVPAAIEQETCALLTTFKAAKEYIETAPAHRLQHIKWVVINNDKIVLLGNPILPVAGKTYWFQQGFLLPNGYDFELAILAKTLEQKINPFQSKIVIWFNDNTYTTIAKNSFQDLSISSFRLTHVAHKS